MKVEEVQWLKPTAHIFYGTHVMDVLNGLPKYEGYEGQSKKLEQ